MGVKNIVWINTLKAISMIFIYFIHCQLLSGYFVSSSVNQVIHTFYVNSFFFISGYLLFWKQLSTPKIEENRKQFLSKRGSGYTLLSSIFLRIMVPSTIFAIIVFLPSCIIKGQDINIGFALYKTIGGGTFWFTSALAISELILFFLLCTRWRTIWNYILLSLCICTIGSLVVKMDLITTNVWAWKQGFMALPFLVWGGLYWYKETHIDKFCNWRSSLFILSLVFVIVFGLNKYSNPLISTQEIEPLGYISSIFICLILVWVCKQIPENEYLSFIGSNSLGFYFMSGAIPTIMSKVLQKVCLFWGIIIPESWNVVVVLLLCLFCLAIAYVVVRIINRLMPWIWDSRLLVKK